MNCTVRDNYATLDGGGVFATRGSARFVNCIISDNVAGDHDTGRGGGVYLDGGFYFEFTNCLITGNVAGEAAGGVYLNQNPSEAVEQEPFATVSSCTFYGNIAKVPTAGGGLLIHKDCDARVYNSIFWSNVSQNDDDTSDSGDSVQDDQIYLGTSGDGSLDVTYSCIDNNSSGLSGWGSGNIIADPSFVSAGGGDFKLSNTSPCRQAGDNDLLTLLDLGDLDEDAQRREQIPLDLLLDTRIRGCSCLGFIVDMGAYEFVYPFCPCGG